ncbi:hypothetical protein WR25_05777 [Diploscapter pachys]|uniref:Uncharacterized protein n=1 Tax=Diploscapter pachys TaxID=2018661 RepID=A0A2A2M1V8_9BILA|nr:hypothetical protein WR25_05777 [Diploscapter pachys]
MLGTQPARPLRQRVGALRHAGDQVEEGRLRAAEIIGARAVGDAAVAIEQAAEIDDHVLDQILPPRCLQAQHREPAVPIIHFAKPAAGDDEALRQRQRRRTWGNARQGARELRPQRIDMRREREFGRGWRHGRRDRQGEVRLHEAFERRAILAGALAIGLHDRGIAAPRLGVGEGLRIREDALHLHRAEQLAEALCGRQRRGGDEQRRQGKQQRADHHRLSTMVLRLSETRRAKFETGRVVPAVRRHDLAIERAPVGVGVGGDGVQPVGGAKGGEGGDEILEIAVTILPVDPADRIVLRIGVVVALLRAAKFVAGAEIVAMAITIVLAIGVVVALGIADQIGEREAIVRREEVNRARVARTEEIRRSCDAGGQLACAAVAAPEAADVVAVAVVPLQPVVGEVAELIAAGADVPRLGDHDAAGEQRVGGDLYKDRRMGIEARAAGEDRREVETEAVDPAPGEMAQAVEDQRANLGSAAIERVTRAGVVDEAALGRVRVIERLIEPAQRQCRAEAVALARVVEDHVEDHPDPSAAEGGHRFDQFGDAAGGEPRVDRHRDDRVIAPAVGEAERRQVAFVDPCDDRHQLDRGDVQGLEMRDDSGVGEGGDRAPLRLRYVRVQHGEAADVEFVDQAPGGKEGRGDRCGRGRRDDGAGDQRGRVDTRLAEARVVAERPVQLDRIGIDQQFRRVGRSAIAVSGAHADAFDLRMPDAVRTGHGYLPFAGIVEQAKRDRGRAPHGETGAAVNDFGADRYAHVMTSGSVRPVWRTIPAIASAAATISASISPAEDDAAATVEQDAHALVAADRSVGGIGIGKIIGFGDAQAGNLRAGERIEPAAQFGHQRIGAIALHAFIVMTGVKVAAVGRPVIARDRIDRLAANGEDVEPQQDRPQAVFFPHVVGPSARAFFAADRRHAGVEQIAEELPSRRRLEDRQPLGRRDAIGGGAGRHRSGDALQPVGIARRKVGIGGEHREAVGWGHEPAAADDKVAVAVTVRCGTKIGRIRGHHRLVQRMRVDEIGVGVMAAEILQRRAVAHRALGEAQTVFEDFGRIGAGNRAHRVECHGQAGGTNGVEVEQPLHQGGIIGDRIDDLDGHIADLRFADRVEVDVRRVDALR